LQGLADGDNTDVPTIRPNQADFRDANTLINSKIVGADKFLLVIITDDQPKAGF